ncbi:hypothetical protein psal_cds_60 [Pandoravirus salinus]|uniref:Uncharacterized protein n=1 Tax=Pandoravirus salinus TaxID=1349410 RepID=S4VST1_9VIRU|nr:hypothetical protein psal_cds_60 [Pandoravirus salinus]AGO83459.1 hypothetical protein psal_cds_60 [Pandoravirus salinus]
MQTKLPSRGTQGAGCRAGGPPSPVRTGLLLVCTAMVLWSATTRATPPPFKAPFGTESRHTTTTTATTQAVPLEIRSGLSPLDPTDGPCESLVEDETCYRRCGCEWCGPGHGHGCHTIPAAGSPANATGPCAGGKPGRRDAFWSCHREAVAWIAGSIVGALATAFLVVVGACWCHRKKVAARCCAWRRRRQGNQHNHARINDAAGDDVWLGGYVSMPRYINP